MSYEGIDNLDLLRTVIEDLAVRISAPKDDLPTYNVSRDLAYPHIEHDHRGFHYVVVERGRELKRVTTWDVDEVLYLIFQNVTFTMACSYEVKNRIKGEDSRRQHFNYQLGLLGQLNPSWENRRSKQINKTLAEHPFDDQSSARVDYCVQLRKTTTLSDEEIWAAGCKKFPPPQKAS